MGDMRGKDFNIDEKETIAFNLGMRCVMREFMRC